MKFDGVEYLDKKVSFVMLPDTMDAQAKVSELSQAISEKLSNPPYANGAAAPAAAAAEGANAISASRGATSATESLLTRSMRRARMTQNE